MDDSAESSPFDPRVTRRWIVALTAVLLAIGALNLIDRPKTSALPEVVTAPAPGAPHVVVHIDFGDRPPVERRISVTLGLTAHAALLQAAAQPPQLAVVSTGSGSTAFVEAIDGLENDPRGQQGWQYWVNGAFGQVSAGATPVQAGDRVLWKFAPYQ